jgi:hypothetical protein
MIPHDNPSRWAASSAASTRPDWPGTAADSCDDFIEGPKATVRPWPYSSVIDGRETSSVLTLEAAVPTVRKYDRAAAALGRAVAPDANSGKPERIDRTSVSYHLDQWAALVTVRRQHGVAADATR